jgi:hypothetical protein
MMTNQVVMLHLVSGFRAVEDVIPAFSVILSAAKDLITSK